MAAVSDIDIVNRAITKLGGARITSFNDNTTEGRAFKAMYPIVRRSLIRKANWNFAIKRDSIASSVTVPGWGFNIQYPLPADFIRLVQVNDFSVPLGLSDSRLMDDAPYQLEGGKIITNYPAPLKIRYLADIEDTTKFDSLFVEAFASLLAYEGCETITMNVGKKDRFEREVQRLIMQAAMTDAIENPPEALHDDSWLESRW